MKQSEIRPHVIPSWKGSAFLADVRSPKKIFHRLVEFGRMLREPGTDSPERITENSQNKSHFQRSNRGKCKHGRISFACQRTLGIRICCTLLGLQEPKRIVRKSSNSMILNALIECLRAFLFAWCRLWVLQ